MRWRSAALVLSTLAHAGCDGGLLDAVRTDSAPARLVLDSAEVSGVEGDTLRLGFTVLDGRGQPIELVPEWARPHWSMDPEHLVDDADGALLAAASGMGRLTLRLAGLEEEARVRIHPRILHVDMEHLYLVQSVQRLDGSVPLVAGRDAALRVFARADRANFWAPTARMTLYDGDTPGDPVVARLQGDFIPESIDDGVLDGSWLFTVPGEAVRPGLRFRVDIDDPDPPQPVTGESGVQYESGPLDVREVPPLHVRFVPIQQDRFGTVGDVSDGNRHRYTAFARAVFPLDEVHTDVRAPLYSSAVDDGSTDTATLLRELRALRAADGDTRYYYGVYRHHGSAAAGRGYVGYPVAIGYDRMTQAMGDWVPRAASTFAHELGHNFGRFHAPGCGAPNADEAFPHGDGESGVTGFDIEEWRVRPARIHDLMGYCRPRWISDYTYEAVLDFREMADGEHGSLLPVTDRAADTDALIVWGSVGAAGPVLEPGFRARTRPLLPSGQGPYRLRGLDEHGAVLFDHRFAGHEVADTPDHRDFAFAIPVDAFDIERLHALRVTGPGTELRRASTFRSAVERNRAATAGPRIATARQPGTAEVRWDPARYPLAVIRDADSGEIIAFVRDGRYAGPIPAAGMDVLLSDGVTSSVERVSSP